MIPVEKPGTPGELLHFGTKGMKWGVRKDRTSSSGSAGKKVGGSLKKVVRGLGVATDNTMFELSKSSSYVTREITDRASEKFVRQDLGRIKKKHGEYGKLSNRMKKPFSPEAKAYRADAKKAYLRRLEQSANSMTNIRGTRRYTLKENGNPNTSQYFWKVSTEPIRHAADDGSFIVRPIFDDEGWIIDLERVDDDMQQTMDRGASFLVHMGVKV